MQRYIWTHLPMALIYAGAVFLIRSGWWHGNWSLWGRWIWWAAGVVVGVLVLYLDRIVYTFNYPSEQLSQQFGWYWKQKKYYTAISLLDVRRLEQERLTFRSALFMAIWAPLALFAITSTTSLFGKGVVMGLMLHILWDAWRLQKAEPRRLHTRLFWLIKRPVSDEERLVFLWIVTGIFAVFSFLLG